MESSSGGNGDPPNEDSICAHGANESKENSGVPATTSEKMSTEQSAETSAGDGSGPQSQSERGVAHLTPVPEETTRQGGADSQIVVGPPDVSTQMDAEDPLVASQRQQASANVSRMVESMEREVDAEVELIRRQADQCADAITNMGRPNYRWHPVRAVTRRQLGVPPCRRLDTIFRCAAAPSLNIVEKIECMFKLRGHDGCVNCLNFNASGTLLASGSDDTFVNIWDWAANRLLHTFDTGHTQNVFHVRFMPLSGDRHVVTCARDCQVRLAELSTTGACRSTRKLARHADAVHRLAVDNSSPHVLLSAGEDGVVFQIDLRKPTPNKLLICRDDRRHKVPLYSISAHPDRPAQFALSGRDPFVRVFDLRHVTDVNGNSVPLVVHCPQKLLTADFKPHVTCVVYNYNGSELLASYNDDDIYSFSSSAPEGADPLHCYQGHRNSATVKGVNYFGPRSEYVVSGSDDGHLYFWNSKSEQIVHFMPADEEGVVNVLEPHPTHAALATSGLDHDVKVWLPTNECPAFDAAELRQLVFENRKRRLHERQHPDMDADFIYYIMHQINRRRLRERRQRRNAAAATTAAGGDNDADAPSNDSSHNSDMDASDSSESNPSQGDAVDSDHAGEGDSDSDGGTTAGRVLRLAADRTSGVGECRPQ